MTKNILWYANYDGENYIVSVLRFNRGWGMSYSRFCFGKGKDGKYSYITTIVTKSILDGASINNTLESSSWAALSF